jgi:hypothetical protein
MSPEILADFVAHWAETETERETRRGRVRTEKSKVRKVVILVKERLK